MTQGISTLEARKAFKRQLLRKMPGLPAKPLSFSCNHCKKYIPTDIVWQCGYCDNENHRTEVYSFLNKCQKCENEPKSFVCHHCERVVCLDADGDTSTPARLMTSVTKAKKIEPKETKDVREEREHQTKKKKLQRQIDLDKMRAERTEIRGLGKVKKEPTIEEIRQKKITDRFKQLMGGRMDIKALRKQAELDYKDDSASLEDAIDILKGMSEEDL